MSTEQRRDSPAQVFPEATRITLHQTTMTNTPATPPGNQPEPEHSNQLQTGIWKPLIVFILFSLTIAAIGNSVLQHFKESFKKEKQGELGSIAELKIAQITNWLAERKSDAQAIKDDPLFLAEVDRWLQQGSPSGKVKMKLAERLASLQRSGMPDEYTSVSLFDDQARLRLKSVADDKPLQQRDKEQVLESMRTGQITFSDLHREEHSGKVVIEIDLVTPLLVNRDGKARVIGAIIIHSDPRRFLFPLIRRWPTPSPSAENLLVRREGNEVVFLNELRHRKNTELAMRLPLDVKLPTAMAIMGHEGVMEGVDYRGVPVIGVLNKVEGTSWYMVNKVDKAEIDAPINQLTQWVLALMLCLIGAGGGIAVFWRDKEKKQFEKELDRQRLEKHLDYLAKYANDIILLHDRSGKIIEFNDRAVEAYGYSGTELAGMNLSQLRAAELAPPYAARRDEVDLAGAMRFESTHVRKNGDIFPVESSVRLVNIAGGKYYQAILRDITERKEAEREQQRLNRALRLLGYCNAALAHAESEAQLGDICKLIVEVGGYRMAWVGYAEHDREKTVRPAMQYGFEEGYLEHNGISWADTERGRGPTGTAIRTGSPQINQNFLSPLLAQWREAAAARGYQSSIALPLRNKSETFGALNIYSAERQAFNDSEVELLLELADNLAYGITSQRMRTERKLAQERERHLRRALDSALDMIFIFHPGSLRFMYINKGAVDNAGYSNEELLKMTPPDILPLLPEPEFRKIVAPLAAGERKMLRFETIHRSMDGTDLPVEVQLQLVQEINGEDVFVAVMRDITGRRRAETALKRQRTFMWQVIDTDPNRIFVKDINGKFLLVNQSAAAAHGLTPREMVGKTFAKIKHSPERMAGYLETDREVLLEGRETRSLDPYTLPDGELRWLLTIKKRLTMPDGSPSLLGITVDITPQKLAEMELAESYKKLQRLSLHLENIRADERAKIALNLHDEMGATLVAIKMGVAWLASKLPPGTPQLREEAARIAELVTGGIRTMHQIVTQLRPNLLKDVGLAAAVKDYMKKFRQHTGIECTLALPGEEIVLDADQSLTLFRILQESLNNIVKHAQADKVNITLSEQNGTLTMVVKDNGAGFDPATHKEQSYGLLGIRERALMIGGKARISSTPGKGARVSVSIPYTPHVPARIE